MNVKELREEMANLPDDMLVLLSSDQEGNSKHKLYSADISAYEKDGYEFETIHPDDTDGTEAKALVLWP